MGWSPSPIAEAFGLGTPTEPLAAMAAGPSAVHRLWRLSTTQGRFAVKALGQAPPAGSDLEALEGPTRLELAAWGAEVPMPRPCLVPGTGAGVAVIADPQLPSMPVRVHEWMDGALPTAPASQALAAALGSALAAIHRLECVVPRPPTWTPGIGPPTGRGIGVGWPSVLHQPVTAGRGV
jgi:Ser/Thr protein kinase RdoA (MazF antagonist)